MSTLKRPVRRRTNHSRQFVLTAEPEHGPVRLEMSGPKGTKDFLAGLLRPSAGQ